MSAGAAPTGGIATVIIAKDAAATLERCVRSCLPFSDEVVLVDSGSTDGTPALAGQLGCRVVEHEWLGYGRQRNFAAVQAAGDWVFVIDVDEEVDPELGAALGALTPSVLGFAGAYAVRRVNSFMGAWLTESPEKVVRLYDRRRHGYVESIVHEVIDVEDLEATAELPGRIWHENHTDLVDATTRLNRYTTLEADRDAAVRPMRLWRLFLRPLLRFGQRYVLQRAFRHGWRGLFLALHWTYWEVMREMKVYERHRRLGG